MSVDTSSELFQMLTFWGYPLMLVLMILEGPIASLSGAFLASLGYFNVFIVFCLSVIGDMIGDVILYAIGYTGGRTLITKAEKFLKLEHSIVERLENLFQTKGAKIIFSVKATTGLVYITFLLAGATRMSFRKFITYSFFGGLVWSALLMVIGYFFGYAAEQISQYIKYAGIALFILAVVAVVVINLLKKKQANKILE